MWFWVLVCSILMINSGEIVTAPWDDRQVEMIRYHQSSGMYHAYTCGRDHGEARVLAVTSEGFVCPVGDCGYTQKWCHSFTVTRQAPTSGPAVIYWDSFTS